MMYEAPEHEFEASHGLPAKLPQGERIIWQGSPDTKSLALHAFHLPTLAGYFAVLLILRGALAISDGLSFVAAMYSVAVFLPLAITGLGLVLLIAWLVARSAVYTLTNRRVVMRIGVVLNITFNLPLKAVAAAGLKLHSDGTGDIPLTLTGEDNIAYPHLWPHARPWQLKRTQPMLRCVPNAARVGQLLTEAAALENATISRSTTSSSLPPPVQNDWAAAA